MKTFFITIAVILFLLTLGCINELIVDMRDQLKRIADELKKLNENKNT